MNLSIIKSVKHLISNGNQYVEVYLTKDNGSPEWNAFLDNNIFEDRSIYPEVYRPSVEGSNYQPLFIKLDATTFKYEASLVNNPVTRAAVEYLDALHADERSNCSKFLYEDEVKRVLRTLNIHWA